MSLNKICDYLDSKGKKYEYRVENEAASIDFEHRGLIYHIWEYPPEEPGASSNVRHAGSMEDFEGDYESAILAELQSWGMPDPQ